MTNERRYGIKEYYALLLVMGSFLILIVEVIFRYILGSSMEWTDEVSRILLVWMTFTGMGWVIRDKKEIVCEAFGQKLPARVQKYWSLGIDVLVLAFNVFLLVYGIKMTRFSWDIRTESLELPFSLFYVCIPIGCLLSVFMLWKRIKQNVGHGGEGR
jgi:TRAP-type C4-dicarboxylate transport system permease small subunit